MSIRGRCLLAIVGALSACHGDDEATSAGPQAAAASSDATPWATRLADGDVDQLLAALDRSHALARTTFGPHRIHTSSVTDLSPSGEADGLTPIVDSPVVMPQHVEDELQLRWAGAGNAVAFSLTQANDHERGREVIVVDETVYFKKRYRPWLHYPLESDLWQRWLDDAWWAVRDAVRLAAPQLQMSVAPRPGEGWQGGDALAIALTRSEAFDAARISSDLSRAWQRDAQMLSIDGSILLDAASGLWLRADVSVRYAIQGADGRPLTGSLQLASRVDADSGGPVAAPPDAAPLPEQARYQVQAERLLDGLAAP